MSAPPPATPPRVYHPGDADALRDGLYRGFYAHTPGAVKPA
jgi:hypothetical protein